MTVYEKMKKARLIPVVVLNSTDDAIPTMTALKNGGLPIAEITFRTACAAEAIRKIKDEMPDVTVGAGTVITAAQAKDAIKAGAEFIVSPGISDEVAKECQKADIPYIPGCLTPTEIIHALSLGINTVKFFPAENYGGINTIKALSVAFPGVMFMPTGGIHADNIVEYLDKPYILACGGSFMIKKTPERTEEATAEAIKIIDRLEI